MARQSCIYPDILIMVFFGLTHIVPHLFVHIYYRHLGIPRPSTFGSIPRHPRKSALEQVVVRHAPDSWVEREASPDPICADLIALRKYNVSVVFIPHLEQLRLLLEQVNAPFDHPGLYHFAIILRVIHVWSFDKSQSKVNTSQLSYFFPSYQKSNVLKLGHDFCELRIQRAVIDNDHCRDRTFIHLEEGLQCGCEHMVPSAASQEHSCDLSGNASLLQNNLWLN